MFGTWDTEGHCYFKLFVMSQIYCDIIRGFLDIPWSIRINFETVRFIATEL